MPDKLVKYGQVNTQRAIADYQPLSLTAMQKIRYPLAFNLNQQIRLVHALAESGYQVCIPESEQYKFKVIRKYFDADFASDDEQGMDISSYLNFSHAEPFTTVGSIKRSLIFPHSITTYCRSLWTENRKYRFSFQGLITKKRQVLLENWIQKKLRINVRLSDTNSILIKLKRKILNRLGADFTIKKNIGELLLWESNRGRIFPIKAWDDEYYRILANTEFVLCPSGDFVWSYRFFESALCGAIPIVEEACSAYEGFRFFSMDDDVSEMKWSRDDAEHNFRVCVEKITIPGEILNDEIARILER